MWGPGEEISCGGFMELMVLAHDGGLLFSTDADALLDRLDALCTSAPAASDELPLLSETTEDRPPSSCPGSNGSGSRPSCAARTWIWSATCGRPSASNGNARDGARWTWR